MGRMKFHIHGKPVRSILRVYLNYGETIIINPVSRVVMEGMAFQQLNLQGLVLHRFMAMRQDAHIWISHMSAGDIHSVNIGGEKLLVNRNAYMGHSGALSIRMGERGEFVLMEGSGILWVADEAPMEEIFLSPGEELIIENSHILVVDENTYRRMQYILPPAGHISPFHGHPVRVKGPGRLVIRHRKLSPIDTVLNHIREIF